VYVSQAVIVEDVVDVVLIVKFNVDVKVQPAAFNEVAVYVPLAVYVVPFHKYELHAVIVALPFVVTGFTVIVLVAVFVQPAALVPVTV